MQKFGLEGCHCNNVSKCLFIEYLIPVGTPAPDGSCHFTYRSMSRKFGRFNSPRHPANYPSSTNCTYIFLATANEQVSYLKKTTSMHL